MVAIDFETYYDVEYGLRKMPVETYCRDERFDPYLVAIHSPDYSYTGPLEGADWSHVHNHPLVAHNAAFDMQVFEWAKRRGRIPEDIVPLSWTCSSDASVGLQGPRSLKDACREILGVTLSKDVRDKLKGKTLKDLSPDERAAAIDYAAKDAKYCLDLYEECAIKWHPHEEALARHTREAGIRGVQISEELKPAIDKLATLKWEAEQKIPWRDEGPSASLLLLAKQCRKEGIEPPTSTAEDDPECAAWELRHGERFGWVAALRDLRKANRALRILETLRARQRPDGTMPFALKYFGAAATGRWSGDAGLNLQNLPRDPIAGIDIRHFFVARPGKMLVMCDLAQIEPRCLAWLTKDEEFLAALAKGEDCYESHARLTMGYKDPRPLKEVDPKKRLLAKVRVLQLGYGSGWKKFQTTATNYGLSLTDLEAQRTVESYRSSNKRITKLWNHCGQLIKNAVGDNLELRLPSGREMKYFKVHAAGERGEIAAATTMGGPPRRWYGGKLVENLVQATAREIFAHNLFLLIQAGFEVLFHVHDEVIVEVDEGDMEAVAVIERIMSTTPEWMPGLPVAAEAHSSPFFKK